MSLLDHPNMAALLVAAVIFAFWALSGRILSRATPLWTAVTTPDSRRTFLVFMGVAVLLSWVIYWLTHQAYGVYDEYSYACASRGAVMYHPNHYLPHIFFRWAYVLMHRLTGTIDSLYVNKLVCNFFGGLNALLIGVVVFRWSRRAWLSFLMALAYAFSWGEWRQATGADVYVITMTSWLFVVWQMDRLLEEKDNPRWATVWAVSLAANLAVLTQNVSALMAVPIALVLLTRPKLLAKVTVAWILLFVAFQFTAAWANNMTSIEAWWRHANYYSYSGYIQRNKFWRPFSWRMLCYAIHDGLFMINIGWEHDWVNRALNTKIKVVAVQSILGAGLLGFACQVYRGGRELWKRLSDDKGIFLFVFVNLVVWVYFNARWTGFDETLPWISPFAVLAVGWALSALPLRKRHVLGAGLTVLSLIVLSYGVGRDDLRKIGWFHRDNYVYDDIVKARQALKEDPSSRVFANGEWPVVASIYFFWETPQLRSQEEAVRFLEQNPNGLVLSLKNYTELSPEYARRFSLEDYNSTLFRLFLKNVETYAP